jgi:hypothetical protein
MPLLTWDMPGVTFDDPRGLTWDGELPNPPEPPIAMPNDNRISATLSAADKTAILDAIQTIQDKLPFLINLTKHERMTLPKMSDKTMAFDAKCASYMASNPALVPGFVDLAEVAKDRALALQLFDILNELRPLCEAVDDTAMIVNSEVWMADLSFYQNARQAAKRGVLGADSIYDDLAQRFPGRPQAPANPPNP